MQKRIKPSFQSLPAKYVNWNGSNLGSASSAGGGQPGIWPGANPNPNSFNFPKNLPKSNLQPRKQALKPVIVESPSAAKARQSTCVTFQKDTDGRSNFSNQRDFQDFCKQRDLFYGIKEIWTLKQSGHNPQPVQVPAGQPHISAQNFDPAFGKMRALFQMNSCPTNLSKLAALFLSQCVLDSAYSSNQGEVGEIGLAESNVRRILQSNPSKLEQLRQRVAPPEATVDFVQISDPIAFLKYFVNSPNVPHSFQQYLMDRAILEISEVEKSADQEDLSDEKEILDLMKKSRLLAKMLGYLFFAPYRQRNSNQKIYNADIESQASLRSYQTPPLDLFAKLQHALLHNRIVFTLPWILEFLSQADPATFFLSNYKSLLSLISTIYRDVLLATTKVLPNLPGTENRTFLRLYCDTLFSQEGVESFFMKEDIQMSDFIGSDDSVLEVEEPMDSKEFIGATLNPLCFHKEISKELVDEFPELGQLPSKRCPSPFPDRVVSAPPSGKERNIQQELESQFFQIHPPSMKKTVDFIAERVASNFVKKLRTCILVDLRKQFNGKLIFEDDAVVSCKSEISRHQREFCLERCKSAVLLLVESGLTGPVTTMCYKICQRKTEEKIKTWVDKHVTKDLFPFPTATHRVPEPDSTTSAAETEKVKANPEAATEAQKSQSEAIPHPVPLPLNAEIKFQEREFQPESFQTMGLIHRCKLSLHDGRKVELKSIEKILDVNLLCQKPWIVHATVTLAIELAAFQPSILQVPLQEKLISFWSKFWTSEIEFLCARNVMILRRSKTPKEAWTATTSIVKNLISSKLVTSGRMEAECIQLETLEWEQDILENILLLKSLITN